MHISQQQAKKYFRQFYISQVWALLLFLQSGPQDQKSVIFLHSIISLNQLLQIPKTLLIFSEPSEPMSKYFSHRIFCIMF